MFLLVFKINKTDSKLNNKKKKVKLLRNKNSIKTNILSCFTVRTFFTTLCKEKSCFCKKKNNIYSSSNNNLH